MSGSKHACETPALPHAVTYARLYVTGWRCARHTPAAEKGRPEAPPGPGWPIHWVTQLDNAESPNEKEEQSRDH